MRFHANYRTTLNTKSFLLFTCRFFLMPTSNSLYCGHVKEFLCLWSILAAQKGEWQKELFNDCSFSVFTVNSAKRKKNILPFTVLLPWFLTFSAYFILNSFHFFKWNDHLLYFVLTFPHSSCARLFDILLNFFFLFASQFFMITSYTWFFPPQVNTNSYFYLKLPSIRWRRRVFFRENQDKLSRKNYERKITWRHKSPVLMQPMYFPLKSSRFLIKCIIWNNSPLVLNVAKRKCNLRENKSCYHWSVQRIFTVNNVNC